MEGFFGVGRQTIEARSNRYDHLGRRVQKVTPEATHTYFYDGWMIAKHESKSGDRVYNQFNPSGSRKELPNWGSPDGWGLCQIDRSANASPNDVILTSEVYNWKTVYQRP